MVKIYLNTLFIEALIIFRRKVLMAPRKYLSVKTCLLQKPVYSSFTLNLYLIKPHFYSAAEIGGEKDHRHHTAKKSRSSIS